MLDMEFANAIEREGSPSYSVLHRTFLHSLSGVPQLETPSAVTPNNPDRVFQLRIYESPSYAAAQTKIEMFNQHELALFRTHGLDPILFGETLSGGELPSLTYMLGFPTKQAQDAAWEAFRRDSNWHALSSRKECAARLQTLLTARRAIYEYTIMLGVGFGLAEPWICMRPSRYTDERLIRKITNIELIATNFSGI